MKKFKFPSCSCEFPVVGVGERPQILFDPNIDNITLECPATWDLISSGNTKGVFQLESRLGQMLAKKLKPRSIDHLAALVSIMRPGVLEAMRPNAEGKMLSVTDHYILRKNGEEVVTYFHPALESSLKATYGEMIYQEQAMQVARDIAGFSLQEADILRKAIGKKKADIMAEVKTGFMKGAKKVGVCTVEEAEEIFGWIEKSQRYSFNKCVCGDTRFLKVAKGKHSYNPTIAEMYAIKHDVEFAKKNNKTSLRKKWNRLGGYGYAMSMVNNRVKKNLVKDIRPSGIREVFRMTLTNDSFIDVTSNHKFPTTNGEVLTSNLKPGDSLLICGAYEGSDFAKINKFSELEQNESYYHDGINQGFMTGKDNPSYTNGSYSLYQDFKNNTPNICASCGNIENIEVHHKDKNRSNSNHSNLEKLCSSCHKKADYKLGRTKMGEKGYPIEECIITSIVSLGETETYDVTMEGPNHTFVTDQRIITCNSHAVSYAVNAYLSAYAKAHFKRAFFTSYLHFAKEKQKPHEEIRELVNNAKIMDVNVYPPDLRRKNAHFRLTGNDIYFGMTDIKGVGGSAIPKFEKRLAEVTPIIGGDIGKWTWLDFLVYLSQKLNKTIVEGLIKVGGLRWMSVSRQRMWHEYEQYVKLTEKEKTWIEKEYMQSKYDVPMTTLSEVLTKILEGPTGRGQGISNKPRHDKISGILKLVINPPSPMLDTPVWLSSVEQSLLGISITCTAIDECNEHMSNSNCKDFITGEGRSHNVLLAVQVDDVKQIQTKHGDDMAFLTVSDGSASLESVVLFPSQWDTYSKLLFNGNTVMLCGERGKKDSFIVENVLQI